MTKHFNKQSVKEIAKSDAWTALNIVSVFPAHELKQIMKKRNSLLDAVSEQILMATTRSYSPTKTNGLLKLMVMCDVFKFQYNSKVVETNSKRQTSYLHLFQRQAYDLEPCKSAIEIEAYSELILTLKLVQKSIELGDFDDLI